jgi:signal transduction histidine kinase
MSIITNDFFQKQGSYLNVESKLGEGARFSFELSLVNKF